MKDTLPDTKVNSALQASGRCKPRLVSVMCLTVTAEYALGAHLFKAKPERITTGQLGDDSKDKRHRRADAANLSKDYRGRAVGASQKWNPKMQSHISTTTTKTQHLINETDGREGTQ